MSDDFNIGTPIPWSPLEEVEHEVAVVIPMWLLRITAEERPGFLMRLKLYVEHAQKDPDREAYSVG